MNKLLRNYHFDTIDKRETQSVCDHFVYGCRKATMPMTTIVFFLLLASKESDSKTFEALVDFY